MTRAAPNVTPFLEIMMLAFFFFLIPKTVAIIRQMFRAGGVNTHI